MVAHQPAPNQAEPELADGDARRDIVELLDDTLFVEASAGTGKTESLVERVVNLVAGGKATLDHVAAITFTESAASELRDRIRQRLELAVDDESRDERERDRCRRGVADLDQAAICTLHAFAALILHERPLEAGLPPGFETSDEISSLIRFSEEWDAWLEKTLEQDSPLAVPLSVGLSLGLTLSNLKEVAHRFHENYIDLEAASFVSQTVEMGNFVTRLAVDLTELERLCGYSRLGEEDRLYSHVQRKLPGLRRLVDAGVASAGTLRLMSRLLPLKCSWGRQSDWERDPVQARNACAGLKELLRDLDEAASHDVEHSRNTCLLPILKGIRQFVLEYAARRRAEGRAEFHDLLAWARQLLRDNIEVRDHFRGRFTHLLIDEAQDTDPIQAEIAMFLAEHVPPGSTHLDRPCSWDQISPERGKLFVVGDPKQSIYRFRRADVGQMRRLKERMGQAGGRAVSLVQNFRAQERLIDWVNHIFTSWMPHGDDVPEDGTYLQARYEAMRPQRKGDSESALASRVWALTNDDSERTIDAVRRAEAEDIAALLRQIVSQPWLTLDKDTSRAAGREIYRPVTFSDICILMPRRTSLQTLEREWETNDIPYRLESSSLIFETQEIRDLLNCLRSIDDPANQVATVATLRSPAFGCSDVDLLVHREAGGSFNYMASPSSQPAGPVSDALAEIREYHHRRNDGSIGSLIDGFIRDRMLLEVAIDHPRMREQWRRYRFMVEQAWQFAEIAGNSLRAFVEWMEEQVIGNARVTETPVQDSDEEAVRVMTVHSAKGLEFPVVILTGINSELRFRPEMAYFDRDRGSVSVGLSSGGGRFETDGYQRLAEFEKNISEAENVRLMYVAATRARDHLVLSLRRTSTKLGANSPAGHMAKFLEDSPELWTDLVISPQNPPHGDDRHEPDIPAADQDPVEHSVEARERWLAERDALMGEMRRRNSVAATSLGQATPVRQGLQTEQYDQDDKPEPNNDEPWRKGRAGSNVGRAVHAVLQVIDLDTGENIIEQAKAQAVVEGVAHREADIVRYARNAVNSTIVKRAVASGRFWREVPVAVGLGDGSLHGFVDLLFEEADGLVVVDYKTDSVTDAGVAKAVERYRLQGGAYAHAVQQVTGKRVKEVVFLYLQPNREESLSDLPQAILDARSRAEEALASPLP